MLCTIFCAAVGTQQTMWAAQRTWKGDGQSINMTSEMKIGQHVDLLHILDSTTEETRKKPSGTWRSLCWTVFLMKGTLRGERTLGSATLALYLLGQTLEMKYCRIIGLTMEGGGGTNQSPFGIWNFLGLFFLQKQRVGGKYFFFLVWMNVTFSLC